MIKVILRKGRDESLRRFHPWVFSGAIAEVQGNPFEGDIVAVHASAIIRLLIFIHRAVRGCGSSAA